LADAARPAQVEGPQWLEEGGACCDFAQTNMSAISGGPEKVLHGGEQGLPSNFDGGGEKTAFAMAGFRAVPGLTSSAARPKIARGNGC